MPYIRLFFALLYNHANICTTSAGEGEEKDKQTSDDATQSLLAAYYSISTVSLTRWNEERKQYCRNVLIQNRWFECDCLPSWLATTWTPKNVICTRMLGNEKKAHNFMCWIFFSLNIAMYAKWFLCARVSPLANVFKFSCTHVYLD